MKDFQNIYQCLGWWILLVCIFLTGCKEKSISDSVEQNTKVDSLDVLARVISVDPDNFAVRMQRARLFYEKNAFDAALKDVQVAMRIDSLQESAYLLKSRIEMDYFRSLEAIRTLRKATAIWPDSQKIQESLAEFQLVLKQYEEAKKLSENILTKNPHSARSYLILGMVAKEKEDTTSALRLFHKAVQYDADLLDAWIEMARLVKDSHPEEAATYFKNALQIAPENIPLLHAYAVYLQEMDSLESAKNQYDKLTEVSPLYSDAYYNKALLLMDQDSFQNSLALWDRYIWLEKNSAKGFYYRGISYEMTGNKEKALSDYKRAKELNPGLASIDEAIRSMESLQ